MDFTSLPSGLEKGTSIKQLTRRDKNMKYNMKTLAKLAIIPAALAVPLFISATEKAEAGNARSSSVRSGGHPAAGSWFGKAVQLLPSGAPGPGIALYMTPTLTEDGLFLGNDSLSLGAPPFGPHTTAHGRWAPTDRDSIVADYLFMLPGPPDDSTVPPTSSIVAARFVWEADVIGRNTMVGHVNIQIGAPIPEDWESLTPDGDPVTLPEAAMDLVDAPAEFYSDPAAAPPGVLVFKFKIQRVQQFEFPRSHGRSGGKN